MQSLAVVALQQWLDTSSCPFLRPEGERGHESLVIQNEMQRCQVNECVMSGATAALLEHLHLMQY